MLLGAEETGHVRSVWRRIALVAGLANERIGDGSKKQRRCRFKLPAFLALARPIYGMNSWRLLLVGYVNVNKAPIQFIFWV